MSPDSLAPEPAEYLKAPIEGGGSDPLDLAQQVQAAQALRKTPWDSLTIDQKLERMREVVKDLDRTVRWRTNRFQELSERLDALSEHGHMDGRVVVPLVSKMRGGSYGMEAQEMRVEGWF